MSSSLRAVAAAGPLHGRVLFLGRSCFPITRTTLSFARSCSHVPSSLSSEHTHLLGLRHLSSGRVRNEQYPPKSQPGADDSDAANAACGHSDAEAASKSADSSTVLPDSASFMSNGGISPFSSGLSVDSNPGQLSTIAPSSRLSSSAAPDSDASPAITANSPAGKTTVDAVSDVNMAKNKASEGAQHKPSRPCPACGSLGHRMVDCPDRSHIKPNVRCRRCGSLDHWLVDCTASSKVRNAHRMTCPICGEKGHPPRDCPNRAQYKPSRPCAACGSPDHWLYDCPDRTHIKPERPCSLCGSMDHWKIDCIRPQAVRETRPRKCNICGENEHSARDCPNRTQHKPPVPCAACGSPDHWMIDCPDRSHIKPDRPCPLCGSMDHWKVDCTSSRKMRKAFRGCTICGEQEHLARDCPNRAQHKPLKPCPVCGSPDHWMYDCPDKTHIKPKRPCRQCGLDHWEFDCIAPVEERRAYYMKCTICGQRGHVAGHCPDRAQHKPTESVS